jgi:hypothetical protein
MSLTAQDIAEFSGWVIPPGEHLTPYDDRMLFSDAVEFAMMPAEYTFDDRGELLNALREAFGAEAVDAEVKRIETASERQKRALRAAAKSAAS